MFLFPWAVFICHFLWLQRETAAYKICTVSSVSQQPFFYFYAFWWGLSVGIQVILVGSRNVKSKLKITVCSESPGKLWACTACEVVLTVSYVLFCSKLPIRRQIVGLVALFFALNHQGLHFIPECKAEPTLYCRLASPHHGIGKRQSDSCRMPLETSLTLRFLTAWACPGCWCFAAIASNTPAAAVFINTTANRVFLVYGKMPTVMEAASLPTLVVIAVPPVSE